MPIGRRIRYNDLPSDENMASGEVDDYDDNGDDDEEEEEDEFVANGGGLDPGRMGSSNSYSSILKDEEDQQHVPRRRRAPPPASGNDRRRGRSGCCTCLWMTMLVVMIVGVAGIVVGRIESKLNPEADGHDAHSDTNQSSSTSTSSWVDTWDRWFSPKSVTKGASTSIEGNASDTDDATSITKAIPSANQGSVHYDPDAALQYYNPFNFKQGDWYGSVAVPPPQGGAGQANSRLGYLSQPNMVGPHLVFVTEGDLYYTQYSSTKRTAAFKLTTTVGNIRTPTLNPEFPYFVAYTATYTGHREVYVMDMRPVKGYTQAAIRLTYWDTSHGVTSIVGWKDKGKTLVFAAQSREVGLPDTRLYEISLQSNIAGGAGTQVLQVLKISPIPLSQAIDGVWNDDCIYFTRYQQSSHTIRYVGGTAESLWAWCEGESEAVPLTSDYPGTSKSPKIVTGHDDGQLLMLFMSDRNVHSHVRDANGTITASSMNLFATPLPSRADLYNQEGQLYTIQEPRALTTVSCSFGGLALREYTVHNDKAVLRIGGDFHLMDPASSISHSIQPLDIVVYSDFHEHQERLLPVSVTTDLTSADVYKTAFGSTAALLSMRGQLFVAPVIPSPSSGGGRNKYAGAGMNLPARRYRVVPGITMGGVVRVLSATYVPMPQEDGKTTRRLALILATDPKTETAEHAFYLIETQSDSAPSFVGVDVLPEPFLGGSTSTGGSVALGGLGSVVATSVRLSPCGRRLAWSDTDGRICVMTMPMYKAKSDDSLPYTVLPTMNENEEPMVGIGVDLCGAQVKAPKDAGGATALYFLTDRDIVSDVKSPWGPRAPGPHFDKRQSVYALPLVAVDKNPMNPMAGFYAGGGAAELWADGFIDLQLQLEALQGASPAAAGGDKPKERRLTQNHLLAAAAASRSVQRSVVDSSGSQTAGAYDFGSDQDFSGENDNAGSSSPAGLESTSSPSPTTGSTQSPLAPFLSNDEPTPPFEIFSPSSTPTSPATGFPSTVPSTAPSQAEISPVFPNDNEIDFGSIVGLAFARKAYRIAGIPAAPYKSILCQLQDDPSLILVESTETGATVKLMATEDFPSDKIEVITLFQESDYLGSGVSTTRDHIMFILGPGHIKVVANTAASVLQIPSDSKMEENIVDTTGMAVSVWPSLEYRQMFNDAWRMMRDYFYDTNMHGVDWVQMHERYSSLVSRCSKREELDDVLAQMSSELSALHVFVYGGEYNDPMHGNADLTKLHEVASLGPTLNDRLSTMVISPLSSQVLELSGQHGLDTGDVIVGINGESVMRVPDMHMLLRGTAGRSVRLDVLRQPQIPRPEANETDMKPQPVITVPLSQTDADNLRYAAWEWKTLELAKKLAQGKRFTVGYVHLRSMMGPEDIDAFTRGFFTDYDKQALIIDVRHNNGGNIDSWLLDVLQRRAWMYWQGRATNIKNGGLGWDQQFAFRGHVVVLIDEKSSSDAEGFARGVSELGLGKLVGTRTWGGGIWLASDNRLVDGGIASAPEVGTYNYDFGWGLGIEQQGVSPDVHIDNNPRLAFEGKDPQLEKAIDVLAKWLVDEPVVLPPDPGAKPDKSLHANVEQC
ncbi:Tricorn protease C1 domain [Fragilaria crotonensis]|nr:Tricorn protease C1 domain [Fragilaria crotonensis]